MNEKTPMRLDEVRARLQSARGQQYWRSLEELAETPGFQELLHREFPQGASELTDPVARRTFLRLMGASLALAGVTACTKQPPERIIPYVKQPEGLIPGKPLFYATATTLGGFATGVLVESHEGRPTKIEGNPDHPASLGAADSFMQATILGLYDPDRAQTITYLGEIRPWSSFLSAMRAAVEAKRATRGAGLRFLTETVTSPTLVAQLEALLAELPEARWHQWEPVNRHAARAGSMMAFGEVVDAVYAIDRSAVVLSLDADFLSEGPGALRYARDFAAGRRAGADLGEMNRLYVVESAVTNTGQAADHRLPLRPAEIERFAFAVAAFLGVAGIPAGAAELRGLSAQHSDEHVRRWLAGAVADLRRHQGRSLVVAGNGQPPVVHALAHAINQTLGNVGQTVSYVAPVEAGVSNQRASLAELAADMDAGRVDLLVVVGGNPVYTAPADLDFAKRLEKVAIRVALSPHHDETAALCHWHVPETHVLESWSDARAFDGTTSIVQPLIAPLYGSKGTHEVVAAFTKQAGQSAHELVRAYWKRRLETEQPGADFERIWRKALHDGIVAGTASPPKTVAVTATTFPPTAKARASGGVDVVFRADYSVYDGRFANNGWLQELPRPHSKLTWDNAVLLNPATADRLALTNGDVVELRVDGRTVTGPVWLLPGQPRDTVLLHLGYGRTRAGRAAEGAGFSAYPIRTAASPWFAAGAAIRKTGNRHQLISTQLEQLMHGRHLVRSAPIDEYRRDPEFAKKLAEAPPKEMTLYPGHEYEGHAWGMAIDLNSCIGCNACVVACQSENNIPVVGKVEVGRGHRMHWLRVDRYHQGEVDNPRAFNQPVPCMHCENAPCEVVCPVGATVHSSEGLNDMAYNRCVGTRYCSNNCPYKVRRFNFLLYQDWNTPTLKLMRNPDVTIRSRGVMEKCTFCVQRINAAKIEAEKQNRPVRDGEIVTACEATCPTQAIVFGDINDPSSRVSKLKGGPRNYGVLDELNTRPRTTYLAALMNPNPDMPGDEPAGAEAQG